MVLITIWGSDWKKGISFFHITRSEGEKGICVRTYSSCPRPHPGMGFCSRGGDIILSPVLSLVFGVLLLVGIPDHHLVGGALGLKVWPSNTSMVFGRVLV